MDDVRFHIQCIEFQIKDYQIQKYIMHDYKKNKQPSFESFFQTKCPENMLSCCCFLNQVIFSLENLVILSSLQSNLVSKSWISLFVPYYINNNI